MSMAELITRLAIGGERTDFQQPLTPSVREAPCLRSPPTARMHRLKRLSRQVAGMRALDTGVLEGDWLRKEVVVDMRSVRDGDGGEGKMEGVREGVPLREGAARLAEMRGRGLDR
ncbi:hypothetical protein MMC13_001609 [Lambiella insularis]|nr:hypothetical protein [Lambiella insularis]